MITDPLTNSYEDIFFVWKWCILGRTGLTWNLDISTTIYPHQMAAVRFELTTLEFRGMAPTHCAIGEDNLDHSKYYTM